MSFPHLQMGTFPCNRVFRVEDTRSDHKNYFYTIHLQTSTHLLKCILSDDEEKRSVCLLTEVS